VRSNESANVVFSHGPLDLALGLLSLPNFQGCQTAIVRDLRVLLPSFLSRQFIGHPLLSFRGSFGP